MMKAFIPHLRLRLLTLPMDELDPRANDCSDSQKLFLANRLMQTFIPHLRLRLLTLPMDELSPLAKYLSDSQKLFLANRLMFNEESDAASAPASLNVSTSSRRSPKYQKLKLGFAEVGIAEDLLNDFDFLAFSKGSGEEKALRIKLGAQQNLFINGVELFTRANFELFFYGDRLEEYEMLEKEYQEDLFVEVDIVLEGAENRINVFRSKINSKKKFNAWFYVDFGEKVFVPKGATCRVSIHSKNIYLPVDFPCIRKSVDEAKSCAAFSQFDVFFYELVFEEKVTKERYVAMHKDLSFSIKSLSVTLRKI